jgi:hypothetical protein
MIPQLTMAGLHPAIQKISRGDAEARREASPRLRDSACFLFCSLTLACWVAGSSLAMVKCGGSR